MFANTHPCDDDAVHSMIVDSEAAASEAEEGRSGPPSAEDARAVKTQRARQRRLALGAVGSVVSAGVLLAVVLSSQATGTAGAVGKTAKMAELVVEAEAMPEAAGNGKDDAKVKVVVKVNGTKKAEAVAKVNGTKKAEPKAKKEDCKTSYSCVCKSCACDETTQCYQDVIYAKDTAFKDHPDWYIGLKKTSQFAEFQEFFSRQDGPHGDPRCPKPCPEALSAAAALSAVDAHEAPGGEKEKKKEEPNGCHTPVKGEGCYNHVTYTMTGLEKKLKKHPTWFPGLTAESDFKEVQCLLHFQKVCPKPCGISKEAEERIRKAGHF